MLHNDKDFFEPDVSDTSEKNGIAPIDKQNPEIEMTDDEKIDFVAARVLKEYRRAFEELAKW